MKIGPKYKICRKLGGGVFEKCQTERFMVREARTTGGKRRGKPLSDFGKQLAEKQRIRLAYGLTERQLVNLVKESRRSKEPMRALLVLLETRLDNVVYRAGLAPSRRAARQMVTHGHLLVRGRKTDVPSHRLKEGERFSVREGSRNTALFVGVKGEKGDKALAKTPEWLAFDIAALEGSVVALPTPEQTDMISDLSTVLEYYSR